MHLEDNLAVRHEDEVTFYDALETNYSAVKFVGEDTLKT